MVDILGLETALRAATTIIKIVFVFVFVFDILPDSDERLNTNLAGLTHSRITII